MFQQNQHQPFLGEMFSWARSLDQSAETESLYLVERVIDGDTIELANGERVRYIGIDTPETRHPRKGKECFGPEATERNRQLVEGKFVWLEQDQTNRDRYGRLLRYVWVDDVLINEALVKEGYAYSAAYAPDTLYQFRLDRAQDQAVMQSKGLWQTCYAN